MEDFVDRQTQNIQKIPCHEIEKRILLYYMSDTIMVHNNSLYLIGFSL
jgi:hypothetical protein